MVAKRIRNPFYVLWKSIKQRCHDPRRPDYPNYGGRGIRLCPEWFASSLPFIEYMKRELGERPTAQHQLDRIDNSRGYEPGNLRWATRTEQIRNRRKTGWLTFQGETLPIPTWAERFGLRQETLYKRIEAGWDAAAALQTPVKGRAA